jgi:hypothetical protein
MIDILIWKKTFEILYYKNKSSKMKNLKKKQYSKNIKFLHPDIADSQDTFEISAQI